MASLRLVVLSAVWTCVSLTRATPAAGFPVLTNVLIRVYRIDVWPNMGSAFTMEVDGYQYLVTAKHVLGETKAGSVITVRANHQDHELRVDPIFCEDKDADVVALALPVQLSPAWATGFDASGSLGGDVYFLGFPFGLATNAGIAADMPFVKKGIVSSVVPGTTTKAAIFYIDGHNNPGFSGGPVVTWDETAHQNAILAVVNAYRVQADPVVTGQALMGTRTPTTTVPPERAEFVMNNSGILISTSISCLREAIRKLPKPTGARVADAAQAQAGMTTTTTPASPPTTTTVP